MKSWLKLQCPDCGGHAERSREEMVCGACGRRFPIREGIYYLLPRSIENAAIKEREREGWQHIGGGQGLEELQDYYRALPFIEENAENFTHYREAARQFRLTAQYLAPLSGKRGLDLGGSIGWAAYRFAQAGAEMALADFNDGLTSGLGAARVYQDGEIAFDRLCVDAENLPLAAEQFDFVFCSAFLHHLPDPARVLRHVARVLKPGGVLIAISESFCPCWMSRKKALARCQVAVEFGSEGINEQVFYQTEYAAWFKAAGLALETVNPRWDGVTPGRVLRNVNLADQAYQPEILANRAGGKGVGGALARVALKSRAWRILCAPAIFPALRPLLLAGTQKFRILIGKKAANATPIG